MKNLTRGLSNEPTIEGNIALLQELFNPLKSYIIRYDIEANGLNTVAHLITVKASNRLPESLENIAISITDRTEKGSSWINNQIVDIYGGTDIRYVFPLTKTFEDELKIESEKELYRKASQEFDVEVEKILKK
jgi:hypothetical protein